MKIRLRNLFAFFAVLLILCATLAGCGKKKDETVSIEVKEVVQTADGAEIILSTDNKAGAKISLGWAGSCEILITTSDGDFYYEPRMSEIRRGKGELKLPIEGMTGEIEKLVITELCLLENRGLPGAEMKDVVVLDKSAGIDGFEDSFNALTSPFGVAKIMFIAVPVLMAAIVIVGIILIVRTTRKNREAMKRFDPYRTVLNGTEISDDDNNGFTPPPKF